MSLHRLDSDIRTEYNLESDGGDIMTRTIKAPHGSQLTCKNWLIEAPYRMLQNNLDPQVAGDPENLIVYGG